MYLIWDESRNVELARSHSLCLARCEAKKIVSPKEPCVAIYKQNPKEPHEYIEIYIAMKKCG